MKNTKDRRGSGKSTVIGVVLLCLAAAWVLCRVFVQSAQGIDGSTNAKRIEYIESFGWQTGTVPDEIEEIRIPARFDEAYEQYNALQKEQGFNLKRYAAAKAQKFTYRLLNYEGGDPVVPINANLIVVDGKIVGADISSAEANGFVTVLAKH
ncbi:MAG: DUF4830 domain-containing protein [Oscillospiraceae bacterium]